MSTDIIEGQVFAAPVGARHAMRRVVTVYKDLVAYSSGGARTHHCKIGTFKRWLKKGAARIKVKQ